MDTELVALITWAIVELEAKKPNTKNIQAALGTALQHALKLEHNSSANTKNLIRMAQVWGE